MNIPLFSFQEIALQELRKKCLNAMNLYHHTDDPQVISFTAPTGSGKTIIATALIEAIMNGDELYPAQDDAIIIWLSDSPELNLQSKNKVELKSNHINLNQCEIISDDSFDEEVFQDGKIYFLNTQKLGKGSNLTRHSDSRTYTIWETLQNTIEEKADRLYCIIDEAHRGAKVSEAGRATTIMQKFVLGSKDDNLSPLPIVVGMSATSARFNKLIEGSSSTVQKVSISAEDVRQSGLLKDVISIRYPSDDTANKDMAVFQAAVDEWKDKCLHWEQYCKEQHCKQVNPVFVVQVENRTSDSYSATELEECVKTVRDRTGWNFSEGEIVHAFGSPTSAINLPSIKLNYIEPSSIADDRKVRIVFFKDSLSTGWDCPRAETMMSFRRASDATYIAQLLGRMIRTPLQQHILVDETLNDVHLYLPHFDKEQVKMVVDALQDAEGAELPTEIDGETIGKPHTQVLTVNISSATTPNGTRESVKESSNVSDDKQMEETNNCNQLQDDNIENTPSTSSNSFASSSESPSEKSENNNTKAAVSSTPEEETIKSDSINRKEIMEWINSQAFPTYVVRKVRINNPLKSLYNLLSFLNVTGLNNTVQESIDAYIVNDIKLYVEGLKSKGVYDELVNHLKELKLSQLDFDIFGKSVDNYKETDLFTTTDADIERQFKQADVKLSKIGLGLKYGKIYCNNEDPDGYKVDFILYASDDSHIENLNRWCMDKFYELKDQYRSYESRLDDKMKKIFTRLISDAETVSSHCFMIPETINPVRDPDGQEYADHLFIDSKTGTATFKLNGWEKLVLDEERKQLDFVCWIRNVSRSSWALTIPYILNNEATPMYPDFLIIRKDKDLKYKMDILEPHSDELKDNYRKAQGLANYVAHCNKIGRVQLIRVVKIMGIEKIERLDVSKSQVRKEVLNAMSNEDVDKLFAKYN